MVYLFYTTYISVNLGHYDVFHAKVGKGSMQEAKHNQHILNIEH